MRVVYLFLAVLGLTKALPREFLTKLDVDSIKEVLTKFNEGDLKETISELYVKHLRDYVTKLDKEQLKEQLLELNNQNVGPIETIILQVLESVRDVLVSGTDTIPVLDPITISRIHIGDNILPPPNYITVNNLTIKDISTFEVEEIKFTTSLLRPRLDFDIVIPAVGVDTSSYDLSLIVFGGDIYGKGNLRLNIAKPRVKGQIVLSIRVTIQGIFVSIQECSIQISLGSFEPVITGMFNDQTISDFVSAFLKNLIPEMLEFFEDDITNIVSTVVKEVGNLILADLDVGDLLPMSSLF